MARPIMARAWQEQGKSMARARQEHGNDKSMARAWQEHGNDVASVRCSAVFGKKRAR